LDTLLDTLKFIADHNVGKLVKWLRMMGYDTLFFHGGEDTALVNIALAENRVILTRDTQIMRRRVVAQGRLKAILIESDVAEQQIRQVLHNLNLDSQSGLFTLCLECNQPLIERTGEQVEDQVPPYVFQTQHHYMECPFCHRIYWRGTHWQSMIKRLEQVIKG
jgi:uncharacterized protein with PIN domain